MCVRSRARQRAERESENASRCMMSTCSCGGRVRVCVERLTESRVSRRAGDWRRRIATAGASTGRACDASHVFSAPPVRVFSHRSLVDDLSRGFAPARRRRFALRLCVAVEHARAGGFPVMFPVPAPAAHKLRPSSAAPVGRVGRSVFNNIRQQSQSRSRAQQKTNRQSDVTIIYETNTSPNSASIRY